MSLDRILVGLLRRPASGYDLSRTFAGTVAHFWAAELSQIYPTLARAQRRGWLSSRWSPSAKGPARRVYRQTARGRRALKAWLEAGPHIGDERFTYLAQLFFMGEMGDGRSSLKFLERLRREFQRRLQALRAVARSIKGREREPGVFYPWLTLRMGLTVLPARLRWCTEAIRHVRSRRKGRKTNDRT